MKTQFEQAGQCKCGKPAFMKFKSGDTVRIDALLYKQLGLRGRRKFAIVVRVDPVNSTCHFDDEGLHGYPVVHQNNLEKVAQRKYKKERTK